MTRLTNEQIEAAARWMCEQKNINPEAPVKEPAPVYHVDGELVFGDKPKETVMWKSAAHELRNHIAKNEAVAFGAEHGVASVTFQGHNYESPWRPIAKAPWDQRIEICCPATRRQDFAKIDRDGENMWTSQTDSTDEYQQYLGSVADAIEQGWLWKYPEPLPEKG